VAQLFKVLLDLDAFEFVQRVEMPMNAPKRCDTVGGVNCAAASGLLVPRLCNASRLLISCNPFRRRCSDSLAKISFCRISSSF